jgi:hypothetical protein
LLILLRPEDLKGNHHQHKYDHEAEQRPVVTAAAAATAAATALIGILYLCQDFRYLSSVWELRKLRGLNTQLERCCVLRAPDRIHPGVVGDTAASVSKP